jgi:2-keto-4-pentenoate hydratase
MANNRIVDIESIARQLSGARKSRGLVEPPSRRQPRFSLEDGYAVGRLVHEAAVASGWVPVGLKLGFTNPAVWSGLGLDSPFWAPIYETTVTDRREVSLDGLVAPRIEPEIVLGFASDLQPGASAAEVSAAIGWAALGFEIVQCHYPGWEMAPPDAVADGGLHGVLVVGDHARGVMAHYKALAEVAIELRSAGVVVASGKGSDALGGPVEAVTWLLRLPGVEGLRAGAIVTTGTLTPAFPIAAGETWRLASTGPVVLGTLEVAISESG